MTSLNFDLCAILIDKMKRIIVQVSLERDLKFLKE